MTTVTAHAEDAFIPCQNDNTRQRLRARLREARAGLSANEAALAREAASAWLVASPEFSRAQRIAGYVAVRGELDPLGVLEAALDSGKSVYLPCVTPDTRLQFASWHPGRRMNHNRFGIPEPEVDARALPPTALDLVIVPLLGFDATGNRLGSGAGYYDRSFAFRLETAAPSPTLAGFAYALQECPQIPADVRDVPLDLVATEQGIGRFPTRHTRQTKEEGKHTP